MEEPPLEHERHEQVAIPVVVEQNGHLVPVVALDRAFAPPVAGDASADGERLAPAFFGNLRAVVVAMSAGTRVELAEVGEEKRAAAAGVLGVAAHHH
jgi:hypothetical protein